MRPTVRVLSALAVSVTLTTGSWVHAAEVVSLGSAGAFMRVDTGGSVAAFFGKKKKKKASKARGPALTPEAADEKRQAIREAAQAEIEAELWGSAAESLESNAAILGDPITFIEAGEARLRLAEQDRSVDEAERSIASTRIALDILHFYKAVGSGEANSDWLVIDPDDAPSLIARAAEQIAAAEALIETIEREDGQGVAGAGGADKPKRKRKPMRPGTGMLMAGAAMSAVGVAGITMVIAGVVIGASKQSEVEALQPGVDDDDIDRLDAEGAQANRIAFAGTGLAVVGLAVGIPLVVFGVKKRRASGLETARLQVAPVMGARIQGLAISGRF